MKKIAWSTASRSNGHIYRWSRWHVVPNLAHDTTTLCGVPVPKAKWIVGGKDYRIQGGNCAACERKAKEC